MSIRRPCPCARPDLCNLTDCPSAKQYRESVQPRWYERVIGRVIAFLMGDW